MHKNPADFPVLNLNAKHSHFVSIDTNDFTINHPFSFFGQDLDPFHFFYIILFLQGTRLLRLKWKGRGNPAHIQIMEPLAWERLSLSCGPLCGAIVQQVTRTGPPGSQSPLLDHVLPTRDTGRFPCPDSLKPLLGLPKDCPPEGRPCSRCRHLQARQWPRGSCLLEWWGHQVWMEPGCVGWVPTLMNAKFQKNQNCKEK